MNGYRMVPTVEDVMTPDPIILRTDDLAQVAVRALEENEIRGAPVIDASGALVGVLSQSDLVRARATEELWARWPALRVRNLMSAPVLTADPSMSIDEAAVLMERAHIHRLVVLAEDQQTPVGVVSTTDIVRAMLGESDSDDDED